MGGLYLLALTHGLRQGEALGLRWDSVNFDTKEVRITQSLQWVARKPVFVEPKTKQSRRTFALSPDMAKRLKQHRKAQLQERLLAEEIGTSTASCSPRAQGVLSTGST
jgi:integrase